MSGRRGVPRNSAFEGDETADLAEVADEIYGSVADPSLVTGRLVGHPTPVMDIWADPRQPRRAIPSAFRGAWDGNPRQVWGILQAWGGWVQEEMARRGVDWELDVRGLLNGTAAAGDMDALQTPEMIEFFDLLALAASIRREGLANPISIVRVNPAARQYRIEAGERRWLAHHLLAGAVDLRYVRIAAIQGPGDVWKQAAENGVRRPLNAISMARQIALLIMDLYPDAPWRQYEDCVDENGHDQEFYAQVGEGNEYPIPRGQLQRILDVTGLKSRYQVSQYRALLRLPYEMWEVGDSENATEWSLRHRLERPQHEELSPQPDPQAEEADARPSEQMPREYQQEREAPPPLADGDGSIPRHYHEPNPPGAGKPQDRRPWDEGRVPISRSFAGTEALLALLSLHYKLKGDPAAARLAILARINSDDLQEIIELRGENGPRWLVGEWDVVWEAMDEAMQALQALYNEMKRIAEES